MRDFYSNVNDALALAPASYTVATNGATVNLLTATGVCIAVAVGAVTGSWSVKLQESADAVTWTDVPAKWVQSDAPAVLVANSSYRLGYLGKLANVRLALVPSGGTAILVGAVAMIDPQTVPVA